MVWVAIYTRLPAELTGLRWYDLGDNTIDERYCGGDCSQKQNGKLIVGSHADRAVLIGGVKRKAVPPSGFAAAHTRPAFDSTQRRTFRLCSLCRRGDTRHFLCSTHTGPAPIPNRIKWRLITILFMLIWMPLSSYTVFHPEREDERNF